MKNKLLNLVWVIFIMANSFVCFADSNLIVSATVDKTEVSLDEFIQFSIKIEGEDKSYKTPKIKLPKLEASFDIVATSQSNSFNIKGKQTQILWQLEYRLSPKKEGQIKIESAEIIYKGKTYTTEEIIITVTPPKSPQKIPPETPSQKVPWSQEEGIVI